MEIAPDLLKSVASLLWPAIGIVLLVMFRPAIQAIIESAKSRKFTVKIAGQELTMEEVNDQQRGLIADLQAQVVEIQKKLAGAPAVSAGHVSSRERAAAETSPKALSILWVDDQPKNNTYFVQQLSDFGIPVEVSPSTTDALRRLERGKYTTIVSDMGREENGRYNPTAGLDLLRAVHDRYPQMRFVIFCSSRGVREHGEEARKLGAAAVTASPTELFGVLRLEERKGA
jgi:CheY-like chemotaxis protein